MHDLLAVLAGIVLLAILIQYKLIKAIISVIRRITRG